MVRSPSLCIQMAATDASKMESLLNNVVTCFGNHRWASRSAVSQQLATRVWSDMARVQRGLQAVDKDKLANVESSALQAHARAMEQLEDIVNTFSKMRDSEGVHEASRLIWNTGTA